jgi:uncharacterized protein YjbI with pentapeptide repeats
MCARYRDRGICKWPGACAITAVMGNAEHLALLGQGVAAWNEKRRTDPNLTAPDLGHEDLRERGLAGINLSGADLGFSNLRFAILDSADLTKANLSGAILDLADLTNATLRGADLTTASLQHTYGRFADLTGAKLLGTRLFHTNLRNATLRGADLVRPIVVRANFEDADFRSATLKGVFHNADFNRAVMGDTILAGVDFETVSGLETIQHDGPSSLSFDTIYRSKGKFPLPFLQGIGVPDSLIAFLTSVSRNPFEFSSCFISYSAKDQEFANRLYADLQTNGVRCWFAPHDAVPGQKLCEQIDIAIRRYDRLLLILSSDSMASQWVRTEIASARSREEEEKRQMLFPIRLVNFETIRDWKCFDADRGKDSAREIREYFIPDFSNWKKDRDAYKAAFASLLKALKI